MGRMRGGMLFRYVLVCVSIGVYGVYTGCIRGLVVVLHGSGSGGEKQGTRKQLQENRNIPNTRPPPFHRLLTLRELSLDAERRKFPEGWKAMLCTGPPWAS